MLKLPKVFLSCCLTKFNGFFNGIAAGSSAGKVWVVKAIIVLAVFNNSGVNIMVWEILIHGNSSYVGQGLHMYFASLFQIQS